MTVMNLVANKTIVDVSLDTIELLNKQVLSRLSELENSADFVSINGRMDYFQAKSLYKDYVSRRLEGLESASVEERYMAYKGLRYVSLFIY